MEKTPTQKQNQVLLKEASIFDIPTLLNLEKSVSGTTTYSPMLEEGEWREALQKGKVYLIEKDTTVVGNLSYEQDGNDRVYISGLVIIPAYQGQGIAREVLVHLLKNLERVRRVDLVTHPDNHAALKLYQSLGFAVESRQENYYGDRGTPASPCRIKIAPQRASRLIPTFLSSRVWLESIQSIGY